MTELIKKAILDILKETPCNHIKLDTSDMDGKCGTNDNLRYKIMVSYEYDERAISNEDISLRKSLEELASQDSDMEKPIISDAPIVATSKDKDTSLRTWDDKKPSKELGSCVRSGKIDNTRNRSVGCIGCWVWESNMNYSRCRSCRRNYGDMFIEVEN